MSKSDDDVTAAAKTSISRSTGVVVWVVVMVVLSEVTLLTGRLMLKSPATGDEGE